MNYSELTKEQLMELLENKDKPSVPDGDMVKLTVDGLTINLNLKRAKSWKAVELQTQQGNPHLNEAERGYYGMEYAHYVFGHELDRIVDHLGGEEADAMEVLDMVTKYAIELQKLEPESKN